MRFPLCTIALLSACVAAAADQRSPNTPPLAQLPLPRHIEIIAETTGFENPDGRSIDQQQIIDQIVERLVKELLESQRRDGSWASDIGSFAHPALAARGSADELLNTGAVALNALALLYGGVDKHNPALTRAVGYLLERQPQTTYARALRTLLFCKMCRLQPRLRRVISRDVRWLQKAYQPGGGWTYFQEKVTRTYGMKGAAGRQVTYTYEVDNSNSQMAMLALRDAYLLGIEDVSRKIWPASERYWLSMQRPGGGWGYTRSRKANILVPGEGMSGGQAHEETDEAKLKRIREYWSDPYLIMTTAGLASEFIILDAYYAQQSARRGIDCTGFRNADLLLGSLRRGLRYFGENFADYGKLFRPHTFDSCNSLLQARTRPYFYYYIYMVERVARASGRRYFGKHDWFRELCEAIVDFRTGRCFTGRHNWCKAYTIIFLVRGKAPILFQKLEHPGQISPFSRDVANLTRYASEVLERPFNWFLVDIDRPLDELLQSPVLIITGRKFPVLGPEQKEKLRNYCLHGGTLLCIASGASVAFQAGFVKLMKELFPQYELKRITKDHPIFGRVHKRCRYLPLKVLDNGVRTFVFFSPKDLCCDWHRYLWASRPDSFHLALNIALYACDRRPHRNLLTPPLLPAAPQPQAVVPLATIKHSGGFQAQLTLLSDLDRFCRLKMRVGVVGRQLIEPAYENLKPYPAVWASGIGRLGAAGEGPALIRYIRHGGVLLADAVGGKRAFTDSVEQLIRKELPDAKISYVPLNHPIATGRFAMGVAFDVRKVQYRPAARQGPIGAHRPLKLKMATLNGRVIAIFSEYDISSGLAEQEYFGCSGFEPFWAKRIAANMVLFVVQQKLGLEPAVGPAAKTSETNRHRVGPTDKPDSEKRTSGTEQPR